MDFHCFYSRFLSIVDYLKKRKMSVVFSCFVVLLFVLFIYIKRSFVIDSSSSYNKLISGVSQEFLSTPQTGVYETIRLSLLKKRGSKDSIFNPLKRSNDLFDCYLKFVDRMGGKFGDEFDSILGSSRSPWGTLFIFSKALYCNIIEERIGTSPVQLNALIQYGKESKK